MDSIIILNSIWYFELDSIKMPKMGFVQVFFNNIQLLLWVKYKDGAKFEKMAQDASLCRFERYLIPSSDVSQPLHGK